MIKSENVDLTPTGAKADVSVDPWYEKLIRTMHEWRHRAETGLVAIRGNEIPWYQNRQGRVRYYLMPPFKGDTALQTMAVFEQIVYRHSGMHRHQGGLAIYVLDGEGYTVVDGTRYDWTKGDLLLLPVKPGGVVHQHFNRDPNRPAHWLALIPMAFQEYLGSELVQIEESPDWHAPEKAGVAGRGHGRSPVQNSKLRRGTAAPEDVNKTPTLLDSLFRLRDEYRAQSRNGLRVIRGQDLSWERNRHGLMRWYLHPCKKDSAIRSLVLYVQELPPAGQSGRQRCPGGWVHVILDGHGTIAVDGVRYDWETGDCIALPIKNLGVEYQFFNLDGERPATYLAAAPNFFEVLGVDLGSAFEQLEDAPF